MSHSNPLIKQIKVDNTTYDICDKDAHDQLTSLAINVSDMSTLLSSVQGTANLGYRWSLAFNENDVIKSGFSDVPGNAYMLDGRSGVDYYYIKLQRLVIVKFKILCNSPSHQNFVQVATGLPMPAGFSNLMSFALATDKTSGPGSTTPINSLAGIIEMDTANHCGKASVSGGTTGGTYYGQCIYLGGPSM